MTTKNMHKWHKPVFSLLIVMAMVFSMLPVSAFASNDVQNTIVFGDPVATPSTTGGGLLLTDGSEDDPNALLECDCEIECTEEAINTDCPVCVTNPEWCVIGVVAPDFQAMDAADDLAAALNALTPNAASASNMLVSVTLPVTISTGDVIQVNNGVTLDIDDGGSITVENSGNNDTGINVKTGGTLRVQTGGELIVDNGSAYTQNRGILVNGNLNVMNGGTVDITTSGGAYGISVVSGNVTLYNGSTININSTTTGNAIALSAGASPGSVQMHGGTINVKNSAGIGISIAGTMTFRGGAINVENTGGCGISATNAFKLDAAVNNVTLTLNGNDKSLETTPTGTVGLNTGTNKATIAVGATAPSSENAPIFRSSPTAAAEAAEANTNYEWSLLTDGTSSGWVVEGATDDTSTNYTLVYNNLTNTLHKNNSGGDEVTDLTGWVGSGLTLTLDGFEFETSAATALVMPIGATLQVNGNATITSTNTNTTADCVGIEAVGALTIDVAAGKTLTVNTSNGGNSNTGITCAGITKSGDGKLNVTAGSATNQSYGIVVIGGNFTMTAGTIIAVTNGGALYGSNAMAVMMGNISIGDIPIKGYDGSAYTIDASFQDFVPPTRSVPIIKTIQDSRGLAVYNAKLGTEPPEPEPPAPTPTPTPSSGGSSSSSTPAPAAPVIAPMDNKTTGTLNNAINAAASAASGNGREFDVKLKNVSGFTKENAAAILKKAKALGKKATVSSDIMSEDGKSVEVRVTVDPELIKKTVRLDGYTRQSQIFVTESRFKKYFDNKTAFVHLGQEGKFGQTAKISAKVDLKDFDTSNLFLYSYDKKTNKYVLITSKDYKIDKNGYLHFEVINGGDIIISNGRLVKKSRSN